MLITKKEKPLTSYLVGEESFGNPNARHPINISGLFPEELKLSVATSVRHYILRNRSEKEIEGFEDGTCRVAGSPQNRCHRPHRVRCKETKHVLRYRKVQHYVNITAVYSRASSPDSYPASFLASPEPESVSCESRAAGCRIHKSAIRRYIWIRKPLANPLSFALRNASRFAASIPNQLLATYSMPSLVRSCGL